MVKVSICVGSACHMKGAYATTQLFQDEIAKAGLQGKVELSASFCMSNCKDGPCVKINDVIHHHVDKDRVASLIAEEIAPLANA
ncbi:MAG: (2Fe-2S) ferredoxin domain-containing protein [Clostridia bacterium]|nr:(2Fe-2S) ferredoxin domain-containing protein [Clostridia bacterium]